MKLLRFLRRIAQILRGSKSHQAKSKIPNGGVKPSKKNIKLKESGKPHKLQNQSQRSCKLEERECQPILNNPKNGKQNTKPQVIKPKLDKPVNRNPSPIKSSEQDLNAIKDVPSIYPWSMLDSDLNNDFKEPINVPFIYPWSMLDDINQDLEGWKNKIEAFETIDNELETKPRSKQSNRSHGIFLNGTHFLKNLSDPDEVALQDWKDGAKLEPLKPRIKLAKLGSIDIPFPLKQKHFIEDFSETNAISISSNRSDMSYSFVFKNTVFSEPANLIKCLVLTGLPDEYKNEIVFVSEDKLKAFQCKRQNGHWKAKAMDPKYAIFANEEKHFHFISDCLEIDEITFAPMILTETLNSNKVITF